MVSPLDTRPVVLDGARLAAERLPSLRAQAAAVTSARGRAPGLLLLTFADREGRTPFLSRKQRACADAGVVVTPLVVSNGTSTDEVIAALRQRLAESPVDAIFVEVPFPPGLDGDALLDAVPRSKDVDVMTPGAVQQFMTNVHATPPLTVSAALHLLDRYGVDVNGVDGVVVGESSPFNLMFREALVRRGAYVELVETVDATETARRVGTAGLVVVSLARPASVRSTDMANGAIAIDVGYFNAGGVGDIDTTRGIDHLAAIAAVPGGVGPMTVSALVEGVIRLAE